MKYSAGKWWSCLLLAALFAGSASGSPGEVESQQKISDTAGDFSGILNSGDEFGSSIALLGDLDGDGVSDLAVGAAFDDDGGLDQGAVWILFLNSDGTVKTHQKISETQGGFTGDLDSGDLFGAGLAAVGDLDGDGVGDLAVGAILDDDGAGNSGAVWVLFLDTDGTVKSHQKISETEGGFTGILNGGSHFGISLASLGDLDGDGVTDLAVGANVHNDGGLDRGSVWILFLDTDGTVKSQQEISDTQGGFLGVLNDEDFFGNGLAALEDLNGDGVVDLAVGAPGDDEGGVSDLGAVWILFLATDGTVNSHQKISLLQGNFGGDLDDQDLFGWSFASPGDLDLDGLADLAVGAPYDDDGGFDHGAVWILFLNADGTVKSHQKISETEGNFTGDLDDDDRFGWALEAIGDFNGDLVVDLAVGAILDDDGGTDRGALWLLFPDGPPAVPATSKSALIVTLCLLLAALTIRLLVRRRTAGLASLDGPL